MLVSLFVIDHPLHLVTPWRGMPIVTLAWGPSTKVEKLLLDRKKGRGSVCAMYLG